MHEFLRFEQSVLICRGGGVGYKFTREYTVFLKNITAGGVYTAIELSIENVLFSLCIPESR